MKQLLRTALGSMSSADVKDIESCVVALRNEALKKEKEKQGKSRKGTENTLDECDDMNGRQQQMFSARPSR